MKTVIKAVALLLVSAFCTSALEYEDSESHEPDMSHWIDPSDMINYDPVTKTMKNQQHVDAGDQKIPIKNECSGCDKDETSSLLAANFTQCRSNVTQLQAELSSLNVTVSNLRKQVEKCTHLQNEQYFQQYIRSILERFKNIGKNVDGHYEVQVKMSTSQFKYLQEFVSKDRGSIQEVHGILSAMLNNVRWFTDTLDVEDGNELWERSKECLQILVQCMIVLLATVWLRRNITWSPRWICTWLFISTFAVSIPWNWWHLYKKELAKRHAEMFKNLPETCRSNQFSFWKHFVSPFLMQKDECTQFYESLEIDPMWAVPPTKAVAVTFVKFFVEPAEHVGEAIKRLLLSSFSELPFYLWVPAFSLIILLIVLFACVFGNYRLRTLLFTIEPHHPVEGLQERIRQLEEENKRMHELKEETHTRQRMELELLSNEKQKQIDDLESRNLDLQMLTELQARELSMAALREGDIIPQLEYHDHEGLSHKDSNPVQVSDTSTGLATISGDQAAGGDHPVVDVVPLPCVSTDVETDFEIVQ